MKQTLLFILLSYFLSAGLSAQSAYNNATVSTEQPTKKINIFPNPTSDYVGLSSDKGVETIRILNLIGKEIRTFQVIEDQRYNVADLDNGMYLIQLVGEDSKIITTRRLRKL